MKFTKLIIAATLISVASVASAQYLEIDGVRGETTKTAPPPRSIQAVPVESDLVACTMDAKMCPDGSYVGRVAPNCEFAPCPSAGTVKENPLYTGPKTEPVNPLAKPSDAVSPPSGGGGTAGGVNVAAGDVNGDGTADAPLQKPDDIGAEGATPEPLTPSMGVLLGGGDDEQSIEEAFRAPKMEATSAFIKFEGVDGESAAPTEASKGKNIRKNITVNLRVGELRAADETRKSEALAIAPKEPEEVKDTADLALFILRESEDTPGVESVTLREDAIDVDVSGTGKLFGLFSISYPSIVSIIPGDAENEPRVDVDLPWYSFLVNEDVDRDELQEAAAAAKKKKTKPEGAIEINSFSFGSSNAGMYRAVSNVLKTKHDTVKNSIQNVR